jgi:hypothetical protein
MVGELLVGVGLVADGEVALGLAVGEDVAGVGVALVRAGFGLAGRPGATR